MYEIQICPVKRLYQIAADADLDGCAGLMVSSYEICQQKLPGLHYLLAMQFDDIPAANHPNTFNAHYAKQIKHFIDKLPEDTDTLFICCDSGESRSAAIASAILRYRKMDDTVIWENPKYHPNPCVYQVLCQAFGISVSDENLDERLAVNRQAFLRLRGNA